KDGFEPQVRCVDSEADFVAALETGADVILADYSLPGYSAEQALLHVRQKHLDIPFIIVSGAVSEETAVDCMKLGAADYLLKDRPARLGQAVRQALRAKLARDTRRMTEDALRESEQRHRSLIDVLDASAVGIFILDADFEVAWANRAVLRFF